MRLFEAPKLQLTTTNEPNVGRPWTGASELGHEPAARAPMSEPIVGSPEGSATRACGLREPAVCDGRGHQRRQSWQGGRAAGDGAGGQATAVSERLRHPACQRAMLPSCWHQLAAAEARPVTGCRRAARLGRWGAGVLECCSAPPDAVTSRCASLEVPEAVHVVP
jgi:hypothetical protein